MIEEHVSLKSFNTFGIEAIAKQFATFRSVEELHELLCCKRVPEDQLLILGGGSNILFTKNFEGLVLKNELKGITKIWEDEEHVYIKAAAGESWHQFVLYCLQNNYAGVENLSLIPGNVGASPMQNIGAYGVEIKDVFHELEAFHIGEKKLQTFSLAECRFGYRESVFKQAYKKQFVIVSVTYRLNKRPTFQTTYGVINSELESMGIEKLSIQAISQAIINIRSSKLPDPKIVGNAGSFFKNPLVGTNQFDDLKLRFPPIISFPAGDGLIKLGAGWLIEQCGWKGFRDGDAGCYPKQALVLVNYERARGEEIYELSEKIIQSVANKFGVVLEREVNIV